MRGARLCGGLALCLALGCSHDNAGRGRSGASPDGGAGSDGGAGLVVAPDGQTLTVELGQPVPTLQLSATRAGQPVVATWSVDRGEVASVDGNGVVTPTSVLGGRIRVLASAGTASGAATVNVRLVWRQVGDPDSPPPTPGAGGYGGVGGDGPAPPATPSDQQVLDGPATHDDAVQILYPYHGTVFPRGLLAPLIQWTAGTHNFNSAYVHIRETSFEYRGYFHAQSKGPRASSPLFNNLPIPQVAWRGATYSNNGAGDLMHVELVLGESDRAYGPYAFDLLVAPGTLKGTVYYHSYGTHLAVNHAEKSCTHYDANGACVLDGPPFGGATLAIQPGRSEPTLVAGTNSADDRGCRVCHSVSANGKRLIAQHGDSYATSSWYDLAAGPNAEHPVAGSNHDVPALYPDGSFFLSSAGGGPPDMDGASKLYGIDGTPIAANGLPVTFQALLPSFSPDGRTVAFNAWGGLPGADHRSLGLLDFDVATKAFSRPRTVFTPPPGPSTSASAVAWPSFLPGNDGVVFQVELMRGAIDNWTGATRGGALGELWLYSLKQSRAIRLDQLNGWRTLPTGVGVNHMQDWWQSFEPTVNPIVSGGYAWVVFTSRRLYGNVATADPRHSDPRYYPWQTEVTPKKLWVAALDLDAPDGQDPSHPAFYLPAQELYAGNSRGYWAVDACHPDGDGCDSGDQCCGGYCRRQGRSLACTSERPACAAEYDRCTVNADCCGGSDGALGCINGFCARPQPERRD